MTQHKDEGRTWRYEYDNDTGSYDESFREFYLLLDDKGDVRGEVRTEEDAKLIVAAMNRAAAPVSGEAEELAREIMNFLTSIDWSCSSAKWKEERVAALLRPRMERAERWIPVEERLPKVDELPCLVWRGTTHKMEVGRPMPPIGKGTQDKWRPLPSAPDTEKV